MNGAIEWELYRSLLGVLREGSLSGAARALGIAQPTVGRHVAALEAALGLALFTRSQSGLIPTEAALALRGHAQAMESTAAALERVAASYGDGVRGVVRVTASEVIGIEVLPPVVASLRARHPDLKVELVLSNSVQDLLQREADVAVRMTAPRQDQLVARRVGAIELGLHAGAAYLQRHGTPASLEELGGHVLIGYDRPPPFVRAALRQWPWFGREHIALRTDSDVAQLALIRAGAGIGICQSALARRTPGLVRLLPEAFALPLDTWVTMHEDLRDSPRCRVTFDALVEALGAHAGA
ncbi:LysR family transcriptional regulator [Herbaspirillum sp. SJZ107]|uniref:LysR family transcriptional regulator n=1 Tax=Herbaspirillum sp. SJZ107 TaxID=2572881 RepID=UPI0011538EFF|nr:LysR substrate-binding domain-containing protein [Herbaspirillum sp. SJZ107]TQK11884.1 LysR family transcriptional regulator [Herbaspirillum sp. SJZ107]